MSKVQDPILEQTKTEARFWAKVDKQEGCWLWTGATSHGYGQLKVGKGLMYAHRYAYELLVGPIPEGLTLDHLCRNHPCVKPEHLEPVSGRENTLRGEGLTARHARANHCMRGHPYDLSNTYTTADGSRGCRKCKQISNVKWNEILNQRKQLERQT